MSQSSAMHGITANWKSFIFSEENRLTLPGCQYEIFFFSHLILDSLRWSVSRALSNRREHSLFNPKYFSRERTSKARVRLKGPAREKVSTVLNFQETSTWTPCEQMLLSYKAFSICEVVRVACLSRISMTSQANDFTNAKTGVKNHLKIALLNVF